MRKVSSAMNIRVEDKFTRGPESKYFYRPTSAISSSSLFQNHFKKAKRLSTQLFSSKSTLNSSSSLMLKMSSSSKLILYDEALQLKHQLNGLIKEIALLKSNIRKKEVEISSKEKIIEQTRIESIATPDHYEKLLDKNNISKIKKAFNELKASYQLLLEGNVKLKAVIRQFRPSECAQQNDFIQKELKDIEMRYTALQEDNDDLNRKYDDYLEMTKECTEKHQVILAMQRELDGSKTKVKALQKDIQALNECNQSTVSKLKKIAIEREKQLALQQRLLEDKKNEEAFMKMKPWYESKTKQLEQKVKEYKETVGNNDKAIKELQNVNERLNQRKQTETNTRVKKINYKQFEFFETNPHLNSDSKVLLMKSLINESNQKQAKYKSQIELILTELTDCGIPVQSFEEIIKELNDISSQKQTIRFIPQQQNGNEAHKDQQDLFQPKLQPQSQPKTQIEEIKEENEQIEDIKLSSEEFTEITYVLMKNIESRRLNPIDTEKNLFQSINITSNIDKRIYIEEISNHFINLLEISIPTDKKRIKEWLEALLSLYNNDLTKVSQNFSTLLFNNIREYNDDEDLVLSKKIKHILIPYKDKLKAKFNYDDSDQSKHFISFIHLKKFLEEEKVEMKGVYGEYLFFKLKQTKCADRPMSLYELDLKVLFDIFDNDINDSKMNEKTETDIEISQDEYIKIISEFVISVNEYLLKNNIGFRELMGGSIKVLEPEDKKQGFEVINIEVFLDELKKINIDIVNELEIYCLFNRYKVSDDFEFLSVDLIINDLNGLKSLSKQDLQKTQPMENVPEEEESNSRHNATH